MVVGVGSATANKKELKKFSYLTQSYPKRFGQIGSSSNFFGIFEGPIQTNVSSSSPPPAKAGGFVLKI
ncbi:MAG: hypothetical protein COV31_00560 [Candidatus Yanofskybacteria bacterium CG10_big_fil_rev_8_21_14_0_10_46_23]|uniref:Uncharacterized protein n=1 Tax=Candidatus Yanofskybacteria bacterium CG10_big_fil_rev_8_21_14_0_10_46_23 TaxID=1975098 RepID=A0A2H0R4Z9_9BACT|nr:MAG: hypothetical protein COV31_00560 [Candidatus Yanofskybacteria bacterium CG10_big_fil_rev_8_21_14_0_10_46_23]